MNEIIEFSEQSLIVGYDNKQRFLGIFVTYPGESFTKEELLSFFHEYVDYMIVTDIMLPALDGSMDLREFEPEVVARLLQKTIEKASRSEIQEKEIRRYIPKLLH